MHKNGWLLGLLACAIASAAGCQQDQPDNQALLGYRATANLPPEAPVAATGAPKLAEESTIADYLCYASLDNPALQAAFDRWKAALEDIPQVRALPDPRFEFSYWVREQAMRDGDVRFVYDLRQEFPWLTKLQLRGDMAALAAQAAYKRFESERLKLFASVKESYYEYQYLLRSIQITEDNLRQLQSTIEVAIARYRTAAGGQADILRKQIELDQIASDLAAMKDLKIPTAAKLNAALGRPADSPLPMKVGIDSAKLSLSDDQLLAWMKECNPDLQAMDFDIAKERASVNLARQDYYPDFMIGFEYMSMVPAAGVPMDPQDPIAAMLAINIPVWREKYAAGVRQAQYRQHSAARDKLNTSNNLSADVKLAAYNFRNADRKIRLYSETLLPRATQALKSTQAAYQTNLSAFSDMVDFQRMLLQFQLDRERALADRQQSLAKLEMLVGRSLWLPAAASSPQTSSRPSN